MNKKNGSGSGSADVSARLCRKTYDHILNVYASSAEFQKRKDADELLRHWNSPAARDSFERRCLRVFRVDDLNCISATRDTVVIQGCLFRVPAPAAR